MEGPLKILHLEDNAADAALVQTLLDQAGIPCHLTCIRSRAEFEKALNDSSFDLIISDYTLPQFDGLSALAMARERHPHTPVIFVSGTIGEEAAVESLRHGATDYVLKDRLARLPAAVRRALAEARKAAEQKRLEERVQRAERLEVIGALAGGIAHDLNNALAPIVMGVQLLSEGLSDTDTKAMLETMRNSARRSAEMVGQMLAFARGVAGEPLLLRLKPLIREMEKLARQTFPANISIRTQVASDLNPILGNPTQFHQVLLNLCTNARDAMPGGGTLEISARNVALPDDPAKPESRTGQFVLISVSDTGHGMNPDVLSRIFEPFFTTKESGKGTGLGLSTVQAIVKSHRGFIEVSSEPGKGATFNVYFPAALRPDAGPATNPAQK